MGRLSLLVAVPALVFAATGCGSEEQVSDDEIIEAVKLEQGSDRDVYAIGGDPFCEVSENLLNDSEEVDAATEGDKLGLVITNSEQDLGLEAVPPFDPKCVPRAKRALNSME